MLSKYPKMKIRMLAMQLPGMVGYERGSSHSSKVTPKFYHNGLQLQSCLAWHDIIKQTRFRCAFCSPNGLEWMRYSSLLHNTVQPSISQCGYKPANPFQMPLVAQGGISFCCLLWNKIRARALQHTWIEEIKIPSAGTIVHFKSKNKMEYIAGNTT